VFGSLACAAIILVEAILQKEYLGSTNIAGINATTAMYFIFIFVFGLTIEDAGYIYVVEIWPTHLRSEGAVIGFMSFFATTIAYSSPSSIALETIGWRYFLVFVVVTVVLSTIMLFTCPEVSSCLQKSIFSNNQIDCRFDS
jgi:hypothetical protein